MEKHSSGQAGSPQTVGLHNEKDALHVEKNLAGNRQVVLNLSKFSICFVITKWEDLKAMLKYNSTHSSIHPTS